MNALRVTLVQTPLHWENPTANRSMLEETLETITAGTDLIVLPEMFTTGFTMNPAPVAEPMNLTTTRWMQQIAARYDAAVTGSFIVRDGSSYVNRLLWMEPDGSFDYYDKRHLFRMGGEHEVYAAGTRKVQRTWRGWTVRPLICYDLRFPVWSRNVDNEYDLLLYVANWPAARDYAWRSLLTARAIENQSYVVGVNRVGNDGNGVFHQGSSGVIDFRGNWLTSPQESAFVHTVSLSKEDLSTFREGFPAYLDADDFEIKYL